MVRHFPAVERLRSATTTWIHRIRTGAGDGRASSVQPAERARELLPLLGLAAFIIAIVKSGWLADDAFTSFRAAANLVNGYGFLSNPPERVQAFTNPLWTLVFAVTYWLFKNPYGVGISMGLFCSVATACFIGFSKRVDALPRLFALLALCFSTAFVDFSTSGLENPLSHLLVVVIYASARRDRSTLRLAILSSLLALNRLDHVLLVVPLLAWRLGGAARGEGRRGFLRELGRVALGFAPLVAWELFSIVYYGFPFPNTSYAKLNATIPSVDFWNQGTWYFVETINRDPLTVLVLLTGIFAPFFTRNWRLLPYSLGVGLYLYYVTRVGGDFMQGRFYSTPFVLAVVILFHDVVPALPTPGVLVAGAIVLFVPVAARTPTFVDTGAPVCPIPESGVADERNCYRQFTGLLVNVRIQKYKEHEYYKLGVEHRKKDSVAVKNVVGLEGFASGPRVHLIDTFALTDPLLARTPYDPKEKTWRIGHFYRALPDGYLETVKSGKNKIKDPCLAPYYDHLKRVTQGPIFSWERFKEIFYLNFRERTIVPCPKS
jgi:arabinofuranosyltransferase